MTIPFESNLVIVFFSPLLAAHDEYFGRTTPVKMAQFTERTQRLGNMAGQAIFFTRKGPVCTSICIVL